VVRFLAEMAKRHEGVIQLTPSNGGKTGLENKITRRKNIYELDISPPPEDSYWTGWGGVYDNLRGDQVFLFFERFLTKVVSVDDLLLTPFSLYIFNGVAYVNIPKHPWLYSGSSIEGESVMFFLSCGLDESDPSKNILYGNNVPVRLETPSVTAKLADVINGIVLNQSFQLSLFNNNGFFDNDAKWNLFNTPVYLKKSIKDKPAYEDFKAIRSGIVESVTTGFGAISIEVSDLQRSLDMPICEIINPLNFPPLTAIDEKSVNKNIPVVYGERKVNLIKLNETQYVAAEYVSAVTGVYGKDGGDLEYRFNPETNILTSTSEADTALIKGYKDNKISEIIRHILERKAGVYYSDTNWNKAEYERFNESSFRVNVLIESGSVKNAIQNVLKNDMAFLIQQNDGKLTLRKYGTEYKTHRIPSWAITKEPEKTWSDAQVNYFSTCAISYDAGGGGRKIYLYAEREYWAEDVYRRRVQKTFDTCLFDAAEVASLAERLSDRFTEMKQSLKLPVGIDTSEFELMDWVFCDMNINGRKFSQGEYFIIKETNPAQDVLTLEEISLTDITGEYPDTEEYLYDVDNLYANSQNDDFAYIIEGGTQ